MNPPQAQGFSDKVLVVDSPPAAGSGGESAAGAAGNEFSPTEIWPEATDFQCSEHATLLAGTQPAPLTVVYQARPKISLANRLKNQSPETRTVNLAQEPLPASARP